MSRPSFPVAVIVALVVLVTAACGDSTDTSDAAADQDTASATSTDTTEATVTTESTTTLTVEPEPESDEPAPEAEEQTAEPVADLVIDGAFRDGEIVLEDRRFEVDRGSSVLITFESDQPEHIHLHGYDLLVDLVPGQPAELAFVADSPGSFEVELEDSRRFLFELLVR